MQVESNYAQNPPSPLVSFIVPIYNLPIDYIKECLESILSLSLNIREREIILVDDGSDVSPINELSEMINDIIYIRQSNQGLSAARNTGIQMARGQYIQFIDGDDCLLRAPYEQCLDIVRYHKPDLVIFKGSHKKQSKVPYDFKGPFSGREYMRNNNLRAPVWGYIFRSKMLGSLRFTVGNATEDEEFTPQLLLRCEQVYESPAEAYFYRQHSQSLTHNTSKASKEKRLTDTEKVILHLRYLAERMPEADRVALNRRIAQLTMDLLYNTIVFTRSSQQLDQTIERLHQRGLFPLPEKDYTKKYHLFRKLIGTKTGRKILLYTLGRL